MSKQMPATERDPNSPLRRRLSLLCPDGRKSFRRESCSGLSWHEIGNIVTALIQVFRLNPGISLNCSFNPIMLRVSLCCGFLVLLISFLWKETLYSEISALFVNSLWKFSPATRYFNVSSYTPFCRTYLRRARQPKNRDEGNTLWLHSWGSDVHQLSDLNQVIIIQYASHPLWSQK